MMLDLQPQLTPGEMARLLGVPLHRVMYVIDKLQVLPIGRAGIVRIFDDAGFARIADELQAIDAKRSKGVAK